MPGSLCFAEGRAYRIGASLLAKMVLCSIGLASPYRIVAMVFLLPLPRRLLPAHLPEAAFDHFYFAFLALLYHREI
jgi:hypothetical protein